MPKFPSSARLRTLREITGLTRPQFANRCGININSLKYSELDERPLNETSAIKIARATGVALAWLRAEDGHAMRPFTPLLQPYTAETYKALVNRRMHRATSQRTPLHSDVDRRGDVEWCFDRLSELLQSAYEADQLPLVKTLLSDALASIAHDVRLKSKPDPAVEKLREYIFGCIGESEKGCPSYLDDPDFVASAVQALSPLAVSEWADAFAGGDNERQAIIAKLEKLLDLVRDSFAAQPPTR